MESRTIKILTALLAAMTFGAIALIVMETAPISPPQTTLALTNQSGDRSEPAVFDTDVPIQQIKWRNIIVHSGDISRQNGRRYHFVVSPGGQTGETVRATKLWNEQLSGRHTEIPGRNFNVDSVGICLVGDFSQSPPSREQFTALVGLVRTLQENLSVPADRVYLYSDLNAEAGSPGVAFPNEAFSARLLAGRW